MGYDPHPDLNNKAGFDQIMQLFMACCEQNQINISKESVAVLYRGKGSGIYLGLKPEPDLHEDKPWERHYHFVKDILYGKYLIEGRDFKSGLKLFERGMLEGIGNYHQEGYYLSRHKVTELVEKFGFRRHRGVVFEYLKLVPDTIGLTLNEWVDQSNINFKTAQKKIILKVKRPKAGFSVSHFFGNEKHTSFDLPFSYGTIHGAKGKTFDAILLILGKRAGNKSNYVTMSANGCKEGEHEELRNVYVGITRPRKVLIIAVPKADVNAWSTFFKLT